MFSFRRYCQMLFQILYQFILLPSVSRSSISSTTFANFSLSFYHSDGCISPLGFNLQFSDKKKKLSPFMWLWTHMSTFVKPIQGFFAYFSIGLSVFLTDLKKLLHMIDISPLLDTLYLKYLISGNRKGWEAIWLI